ncbi:MAG: hypothetical protein ACYC63_04955 [Armatimonadota bacterium]
MASRSSINSRAKGVEVLIQQFLWPGSTFAGGAKRPAHEDEDLRGPDKDWWPLWGEAKNYAGIAVGKTGAYVILSKALDQCLEAVERNQDKWPEVMLEKGGLQRIRPKVFSALWPVGSRSDQQRLVMWEIEGERMVMTLVQFKRLYIERAEDVPDADL